MELIKFKDTDIILQNFEKNGQGKIIVADNWRGAFTYSWGAMGSDINNFICDINNDYFARKLLSGGCYTFSGKKSVSNVRKYIREELYYDLPWYKYMGAQKELREALKTMENTSSPDEFVYGMSQLSNRLMCYELDINEERDFMDIVKSHFENEPWHFIGEDLSNEYHWLCDIHNKLKKELKRKT